MAWGMSLGRQGRDVKGRGVEGEEGMLFNSLAQRAWLNQKENKNGMTNMAESKMNYWKRKYVMKKDTELENSPLMIQSNL